MDRSELVAALYRARVPDALYDIPGVHDIRSQPDACYFLRPDCGAWVVGVRERSRDSVLDRFGTEDEACHDLYTRLSDLLSAPLDAAERIEQVLAQRAEDQRGAGEAGPHAPRESAAPGPGAEPPPQ